VVLALETEFWLRSARTSRIEKVRNEIIIKNGNKNVVLDNILAKQLVWYRHV
jgi:hypothetical protein